MVSLEVFGKMFSLPLGRMNFEEYDVNETRHEICIPFSDIRELRSIRSNIPK